MSHAPASTLTLPSAPRTGFQLGGCATDPASPGAPPGQVPPPRPTATSGRVLPSWRGDTIHQVFCWKHHQCPPVVSWRKAWRGEGVGVTSAVPELLAASAKPPRPFLQQVLLRRLRASAQSGSQTDTQTGTHGGDSPEPAERMEAAPPQCWRQAGDTEDVLTGPWDQRARLFRTHRLCFHLKP